MDENGQEESVNQDAIWRAEPKSGPEPPRAAEFDAVDSLLRLLIGAAAEGADALLERLERAEAIGRERVELGLPPADEPADLVRYALAGLLVDGTNRTRRTLGASVSLLADVMDLAATVTGPVAKSWLLRPLRRRGEELANRGRIELMRLIHQGYVTESQGRRLTHTLADETVAEVIAALAQDPDVRVLVQQQGIGLVGDVANGMRDRSVNADALVEALLRRLLGRRPRQDLPAPPPSVQAIAGYHVSAAAVESANPEVDED